MTKGTIEIADIDRLRELAEKHLYVKTDAKSHIKGIPDDLREGSYRWRVYLYSNMYRPGEDTISVADKAMFIRVSRDFQGHHLNPWSREKAFAIDLNKYQACRQYILSRVYVTSSFHELRVCLYLLASFRKGTYIYDEYILKMCPGISKY